MNSTTPLSIERLFAAPPLSGRVPQQVSFSPDGHHLAFLLGAADDHTRLELWLADAASGAQRNITPRSDTAAPALTAAERDQRERRRIFSHGVVEYEWLPDSSALIVPLAGTPWLCGLDGSLRALGDGRAVSHTCLAPDGSQLAAVLDGNLVVISLDDGSVRALTDDGGGVISNGLPEFIAQEEMHRHVGFWWSPDSQRIAFTRVDEAPVALSRRYDIDAGEIRMVEQRYPYAGAANAAVALLVVELGSGWRTCVRAASTDDYLARVCWQPDSRGLLSVVQNRLQNELRLLRHACPVPAAEPAPGAAGAAGATASAETLLRERSASWINLYDAPRYIDATRFLWHSERDGFAHLYLWDNGQLRQLTRGSWTVERVVAATAQHVWLCGWRDDPTERHLFRLDINGTRGSGDNSLAPLRLTRAPGWHDAGVSNAGLIFDLWSHSAAPPQLQLLDAAGNRTRLLVENDPQHADHPLHPYHAAAPQVKFVQLAASNGQILHARLTLPHGFDPKRRWPVLVHVYGGPGVQRVTKTWQLGWPQYLARRGYVIFELDNRGSSNRGRAFEAPIHRHLGRIELEDQLAGTRWLGEQAWVDTRRIAVYGHSYGGYMALMCLARAPEVFRAAIAVAPVSTWTLYDTHYTERYLGLPQDNPQGYAASDVFTWLEGIRGPLLLMHGMADDNVLFTHTTRLLKALQDANLAFDLMTYPGSKHGLAETSVSIHRFNHMTRFLERVLAAQDKRT